MLANLSAPSRKIQETSANVSTLLIIDGLPHKPLTAGNGGRGRGIPRFPSIEFKRAVSSPQTKAPAPKRIWHLNENPLPKMLSPNKPTFSRSSIAFLKRATAIGYSART